MLSTGCRLRLALAALALVAGCTIGPLSGTDISADTYEPPITDDNHGSASGDGSSRADAGSGAPDAQVDPRAADAGQPRTDAGSITPEDDAATPVEPPPEDDPAFAGEEVCSSGRMWTDGGDDDDDTALMHPGHACNACHRREEKGPIYSIAGTLYLTGHEPDDCNGATGSLLATPVVEVRDAAGSVARLTPNAAGNFFSTTAFTFPVTAKVLFEGRERPMDGEISAAAGDCNLCHTNKGKDGAPGRIALP